MKERLIDTKKGERVQQSRPVPYGSRASGGDEEAFKKKVLEAATSAKSGAELVDWNAHMRIGQSGPLDPYPDPVTVLEEAKTRLDRLVCARASLPREQGTVLGDSEAEISRQPRHRLWRERASVLWRWTAWRRDKAH